MAPTLTDGEMDMLRAVAKQVSSLDFNLLAEEMNMKPNAIRMRWARFRDKIADADTPTKDGPKEATNTPKAEKAAATPKQPRRKTPAKGTPKTPKKAGGSESECEAAGGAIKVEEDESPIAKKRAKKVKVEQMEDDEDSYVV